MNILVLLLVSIACFFMAYKVYAAYIEKTFNAKDSHQTPANSMADGRDYVAGKTPVVFSHHFAAIAGGGPIIGPTVALLYGFYPSWMWIVLGGIFLGAVHDYTALFISMRERGKSMAEVARTTMGNGGFILFILFTLFLVILVCGAFLGLTATALASLVKLRTLQLPPDQTLLRTVVDVRTGEIKGLIGGIASTSAIVITMAAPFLGYLLYRRGTKIVVASIIAVFIAFGSIQVGMQIPVTLSPEKWMLILSVYCFFAAGAPVWVLLQPRDFINAFILYGGMGALLLAIIAGGVQGIGINAPAVNITGGEAKLGLFWPIMFITVACGAISGFHALIAGGTTSKQVATESAAKRIAFGGMLAESALAVMVLITVASGLPFSEYTNIVFPEIAGEKSNPLLAFSLGMGLILNKGLSLPVYLGTIFGMVMVEGFLATTLDTAVRVGRYLLEELWKMIFDHPHAILKSFNFNAGLVVVIMFLLAYKQAFLAIWPIFGSANQLLAALTLIVISVWLTGRGRPNWFTILPSIFMMVTTVASLLYLLKAEYIPSGNMTLIGVDIVLVILASGVAVLAWNTFSGYRKGAKLPVVDPLMTD
ncbi:MAG: carbon starvation CstA family protein [Syntrophales bacterium]|nr:carbon starvation CstA family protein [Syntrophales bacterium]